MTTLKKKSLCKILKFRPRDDGIRRPIFSEIQNPCTNRRHSLSEFSHPTHARTTLAYETFIRRSPPIIGVGVIHHGSQTAAGGQARIELEASAALIRANNSIAHVVRQTGTPKRGSVHPVALRRQSSHYHQYIFLRIATGLVVVDSETNTIPLYYSADREHPFDWTLADQQVMFCDASFLTP